MIAPARAARWPSGRSGPVVQPVDRVAREPLEQAVGDHHAAAALGLLGGLEDEVDGAVEAPGGGELARRAEQHRGVAVVAAGVHDAVRAASGRGGGAARGSAARPCRRAGRSRGAPLPQRSVPTTPVPARPRWTSMPNDSQRAPPPARRCGRSSKATSGWRWKSLAPGDQLVVHRGVEIGHDGRDYRTRKESDREVQYRHRLHAAGGARVPRSARRRAGAEGALLGDRGAHASRRSTAWIPSVCSRPGCPRSRAGRT